MTKCAVCGIELFAEEKWRLRPDITPGKLESEYDEDYVYPYCHKECHMYFYLLEKLAELEHEQWRSWINYCIENYDLPEALVEKWRSNDVDYSELSDELKEKDRKWARKALREIRRSDRGGELK